MYSEKDKEDVVARIDEIADDILEISAGLNSCGEAIECKQYSSKLIASAAMIRAIKKRLQT